jgi:hypothetical protein
MLATSYGAEQPGHITPAGVISGIYVINKVSKNQELAAKIHTSADPTGENTTDPSHF